MVASVFARGGGASRFEVGPNFNRHLHSPTPTMRSKYAGENDYEDDNVESALRRRRRVHSASTSTASVVDDELENGHHHHHRVATDSKPYNRLTPRRGWIYIGAIVIIVFIFGLVYEYDRRTVEGRYLTTTAEQPLSTLSEDFLSSAEFESVKSCALRHDKLRVRNGLNPEGFNETRGFVLRFNAKGVESLRAREEYSCFVNVFEKLRLPLTNAYVMNLLLCVVSGNDDKEGVYNSEAMSVELHLDDTVAVDSRHEFVAHQVNVLYVSVPSDMEGGTLEVFDYSREYENPSIWESNSTANAVVTPKENLMVTFRGDAFHRVRSYRTQSSSERISLVLEQYYIADEHYGKTTVFQEQFERY
jgi:hypothetical protein